MIYVYVFLGVFAFIFIMLGFYVGYIQHKYDDIRYDNVLNFSNTCNLTNTFRKFNFDDSDIMQKKSSDDSDIESRRPVIIKSVLVEENLDIVDEEIL